MRADDIEIASLRRRVVQLERELAEARAMATVAVLDQQDERTTTVVARIAALGFVHTPRLAWKAGAAAQSEWRRVNGGQPPKANTAKVSGTGAHCHARYPLSWSDALDEIITECATGDARQYLLPLIGGAR